jgi:hypothetical protein
LRSIRNARDTLAGAAYVILRRYWRLDRRAGEMRRVSGGGGAGVAGSFCAAGLVLLLLAGAALAQQSQHPAPAPAPTAAPLPIQIPLLSSPPAAQGEATAAHPAPTAAAPAANLSKFEARRVRHACQERANEKALKGKEREDFLLGCIFGRSVQRRAVRRECRKEGLAKGLEKAALHDFIHQCAEAYYAGQKPAE